MLAKSVRRWAVAVAVAVVVVAAILVALPLAVRHLAIRRVEAMTGRPVAIADVDLNVFTRRMVFSGVRIGSPGEAPALADVPRVEANFRLRPFRAGRGRSPERGRARAVDRGRERSIVVESVPTNGKYGPGSCWLTCRIWSRIAVTSRPMTSPAASSSARDRRRALWRARKNGSPPCCSARFADGGGTPRSRPSMAAPSTSSSRNRSVSGPAPSCWAGGASGCSGDCCRGASRAVSCGMPGARCSSFGGGAFGSGPWSSGSTARRRPGAPLPSWPPGGRVTLVRVVDPPMVPSPAFFRPTTQARLSREFAALHTEDVARAMRDLDAVATRLTRAGWTVRTIVPSGGPLREVLATVRTARADLLVVGAHGATGLKRILLGSVAEGALNRCPVPVLVVR